MNKGLQPYNKTNTNKFFTNGYTIIISFCFLLSAVVNAQEKVNYQLCDDDFSPLYLRKNLPKDAAYINTHLTAEQRARDVVKRLTLDEKIALTGGWRRFFFPPVPRLGLSPVFFSDASQGLRIKNLCVKIDKSTAYPGTITLAATWDTDLAYAYAKSIGEECQAWGAQVLLGPGMNMYRNSEGGRNYEYLGEDPYLVSALSVAYVKGLQSTGTIATVKHFLGNEQEAARHVTNASISERALREIYLPPFMASITQGGALAVMTGNNLVNNYPGAANAPLSGGILRDELGFKGVVMSDWANTMFWDKRIDLELTSGHSLLMENNEGFAKYLRDELRANPEGREAIEKALDKMVFYNLYTFFKAGVYDRPFRNITYLSKMDGHKKVALQTAEEGITLLKNEGNILPINTNSKGKIVILGTKEALNVYTGKGSGSVEGYEHVDYVTGLKNIYGDRIVCDSSINDEGIKSAAAVLYFINKEVGEGFDVDFNSPDVDETIKKYAALNKNLIVIYSSGNGMAMPWLLKVKGLIFAYLSGQERGTALANIISGKISPSGKLPFTIEKDFKDSPAWEYNKLSDGTYAWLGGRPDSKTVQEKFGQLPIPYKEGIYIGYRWFEKKAIQPQFPFGFGLSYTTFSIGNMKTSATRLTKTKPLTVNFTVSNTGKMAGTEVVQLYVQNVNASIDRPIKELKGFKRVYLQPGESKKIALPVQAQDLAYWDESKHAWQINSGQYEFLIGSSSKDIRQKTTIVY